MKGRLVAHRKPAGRRVELTVDGQPVSWAELPYLRLRVGRAVLRCGGIGDVYTKREHRKRGYSRRVIARCIDVMAEDGIDVAMLFGIPDYYHKFGFRTTLNDCRTELPARAVIGGPMTLRPRRVPARRHADILPLYRKDLACRGFGIERARSTWPGYRRGVQFRSTIQVTAFHRAGRAVGYVALDDDPREVRIGELASDDPDVLASILTWLGRQCRRKLCENIVLHLPPHHPACRAAVELGATFRRTTHATGGGMMRIVTLGSTLAAMTSELTVRWAASSLADSALHLALRTDLGNAALALPGRRRAPPSIRGTVRIGQDRLVQLLVGYLPVSQVAAKAEVRLPRRLVPALEALFPTGHPAILPANCF